MWITLGLIAINVIVYAQVRHHEFINFDDPQYVSENRAVTGGLTWQAMTWAVTTGHAGNWHPLTWLSHLLDVQVYGVSSGPHHLTNLLLHSASSILLFGLFHRMTGAPGRSAFVAALFAVHPLHVESVAWLAERKDVLSTLFWMLTLWAYLWYVKQPGLNRYALVLVTLALGLMAKPMLVTLPFVLLLLDWWPLGRWARGTEANRRSGFPVHGEQPPGRLRLLWEKLPLVALAIASSVVTIVVQRQGGAVKGLVEFPLRDRVSNALVAYVAYIGKMLWPTHLAVIYPYPPSQPGWRVIGALLGLIAVSIVVVRAARQRPYLLVGWLWYLVTLLPVIGLIQVGSQPMADRYTYIPLIGPFIMVAWGISELFAGSWQARRVLPAAAAMVILGCTIAARGQVGHWKSSIMLWEHALEVTRDNYRAQNNLGHALARQGRLSEAIPHYAEALRIKPGYAEAHHNMGIALAKQGRVNEAIDHYSEALRLEPDFDEAHNNLGIALAGRGSIDDAILHFMEAVRIKPGFATARKNLGLALAGRGRISEAIAHYSEALRLEPGYVEAHNDLGLALASQGRMGDAIAHYSEALRLRPNYAEAHNNLGNALADQGNVDQAIAHYVEAVRLNPDFAAAHSNLGRALADRGRVDEAIRELLEALRIRPDDADCHYDVAVLFARKGDGTSAGRHFEAALTLNPNHQDARRALEALRRPPGGKRRTSAPSNPPH